MKTTLKVLLIVVLGSVPAWATLGQYEGSVSVDQQNLRSQDRVQSYQTYKVHQLTTANGTVVREFISPNGMVFGVAWQAPFMPDVKQLLGSYVNSLQNATPADTRVHDRRAMVVKTSDFIYVSGGHMRFYRGHAFVPSLVPSNVSVEVVR